MPECETRCGRARFKIPKKRMTGFGFERMEECNEVLQCVCAMHLQAFTSLEHVFKGERKGAKSVARRKERGSHV